MVIEFKIGDVVRIKQDSFGDSTDKQDLDARGKVGVLTDVVSHDEDGTLWLWHGLDGTRTYPVDSELEAIKPALITPRMVMEEVVVYLRHNVRQGDDAGLALLNRVCLVLAYTDKPGE